MKTTQKIHDNIRSNKLLYDLINYSRIPCLEEL